MTPAIEDVQALFQALFDTGSDAILVVDGDGRISLANSACERLLGYAPAELIGKNVELLVPSRFHDHARQREAYAAGGRPRPMGLGYELFARCADGREVPVDISLTPVAQGGWTRTACVIRDLRGRARGPDALRVQATALRSAANGVVITDRAGTITWVNPAACAITGYPADELIGRHTRLLKSGEHDEAFFTALWQTVSRGETWSGTIVNRRKNGTLYHEEQTIAPVLDDEGKVTHFIAIKQDVSARRRSEEALALAHAELAAHVEKIESLNRQLREQSIRDPLTNLYNRRYFQETISRDAARAARTGEPLAIVAIDIDHFKRVNDEHGHAAGDQVLRALADVLRTEVRASDMACRIGGEEFVVVILGATIESVLRLAERWRGRFASVEIPGEAGPVRSTVSIGVARYRVSEETVEATLRRADAAMYEAKRAGRNAVVSAEGEPVPAEAPGA